MLHLADCGTGEGTHHVALATLEVGVQLRGTLRSYIGRGISAVYDSLLLFLMKGTKPYVDVEYVSSNVC